MTIEKCEALKRIAAFVAVREKMAGTDPEVITESNGVSLLMSDLRAALSPAELGGVEWPVVFAERLADGWRFEYEPETKFVGLRHPQGGRQSVVRVEYGAYADEIGAAIAASMNASTPRAAEAVAVDDPMIYRFRFAYEGCPIQPSEHERVRIALTASLTPPAAKGE